MKRLLTLAVLIMVCFSTTYAATITPTSDVVPVEFTQELNDNSQPKSSYLPFISISKNDILLNEATVYECCQTLTATLTDGEGNFASASATFCSVQSCDVASSLASTMALIKASQMLAQY